MKKNNKEYLKTQEDFKGNLWEWVKSLSEPDLYHYITMLDKRGIFFRNGKRIKRR